MSAEGADLPKNDGQTPNAFYEAAWDARRQLVLQWIEEGEREVSRLIGRLEQVERVFLPSRDADSGAVSWVQHLRDHAEPFAAPMARRASWLGRFVTAPSYSPLRVEQLVLDYMTRQGGFDLVCELGCGYGRNLFNMRQSGSPRDMPLFGGELSLAGLAFARTLADCAPQTPISFFPFDHTAPDLAALPRVGRALIFTCHSIEQVYELPTRWFDVVAHAADVVHVLHFEPCGFQINPNAESARQHRKHFLELGWNLNLVDALRAAIARDPRIRLRWMSADSFPSADEVNATSVVIWTAEGVRD